MHSCAGGVRALGQEVGQAPQALCPRAVAKPDLPPFPPTHAGIYNICRFGGPGVFKALSPHYMYYFWSGDAAGAWKNLGNIMLCVTGAEALYADMGARCAGAAPASCLGMACWLVSTRRP